MAVMISSNEALAGTSWRSWHQSEIRCIPLVNCCFSSLKSFRKMHGGSGG